MKTERKILRFTKIKIARVDSLNIIGKGTNPNTLIPNCASEESRTPKGGRTQSTSHNTQCDTTN
ncbi:hypothetical protein [Kordia sp.]|uniref:hypothetical protein n=1 Tax=Kordia sp. TaxID=1965332 RepID=UPI0025C41048|nr:hypothetical protein [Kordia sp.]MCH2193185.1 hypothetical protein [Kordia sp.]